MTEFYVGKPCKYGHQSGVRYASTGSCVECERERELTPKQKAARATSQRLPHRKAYNVEYQGRPEVRARRRESNRLRQIGVTPTEFNFTLAGQNFCCGKCGATETGTKADWNADHCHETGRFRGVLCTPCNTGLGKLGDNVEGLLEAIEYIVGETLPTNLTKPILQMAGLSKASLPTAPNESKQAGWSAGIL